jgi:exo-1,4-beta-D-glucosaminidase
MPKQRLRLLIAALLVLAGFATPAAEAASSPARGVHHLDVSTLGQGGWKVQSSGTATQSGKTISTPGFSTSSWLSVKPDDAGAPGTEIEALLQNGSCPNVFYSTNMKSCFGYMSKVGAETVAQFKVPWWFRTDFQAPTGTSSKLIINGVVGQADVWVNGKEVATQSTVEGAYTRYSFDISGLVKSGTNSLAIEMYANNPAKMFTLDDVDWNQIPPDNNTGIQFPVQLQTSAALSVGNAHVVENNAADLSSSALTAKADVTNNTTSSQTGVVNATITPPGGGSPIALSKSVTVAAGATTTVSLTHTIGSPQVWWPYSLGAQPLYGLSMNVAQGGTVDTAPSETFAIRTVTSTLTGASAEAPQGVRLFSINGKAVQIRGGGWSENLFLHYSAADTANQIKLIKSLGLNTIRTEGKEMPDDFYEQMDRAGIMIDAGFQCCDKWEPSSDTVSSHDQAIMSLSALTIGQRLRNHPSVINYSWSDNAPVPTQEKVSVAAFAQADFQDPLISSAEYNSSPILGQSGEKEGPYDWVPPDYWYDTTHYDSSDSTRTNVGGAWALDSEQSGGDTVPTLDSIQRFMSPSDQAALWQNPSFNQYHANYEPGTSGYAFGTLFNLDTAIKARYGAWSSLDQYVEEAQVQNYEDTRAQFEAFIDKWKNTPTPATGTIYWQLNKGWPTLLWDLYNNDYDQAGGFFGAQKANEGLHALFSEDNGTVNLDNLGASTASGLSVEAKVRSLDGTVTDDQTASGLSVGSQGVLNKVLTPKVQATTVPPAAAKTYFVELTLKQGGTVVDRNVYWRSTQADIVNWGSTEGNPQATMDQFGNLQGLSTLPKTTVTTTAATVRPGVTQVTLTNNSSSVGFFLRADVRRGNADGTEQSGDNQVLPISWSDNDVTLWPGESETLTATYDPSALNGATPVVSLSGWNVARSDVPARR